MTTPKNHSWGGARKGSGPKPKADPIAYTISIVLTATEAAQIRAAAKAAGVSVSAWIRSLWRDRLEVK